MNAIWNLIKQHKWIALGVAIVVGFIIYTFIKSKQQTRTGQRAGTPGQTQAGQQFYLVTLGGDEEAGMPINPGLPVPHPPIGPNPPVQNPPPTQQQLNTYTLFSPKALDTNMTFGTNSVLTWLGFSPGEYQDEYKYTLKTSWSSMQVAQAVPGVQVQT